MQEARCEVGAYGKAADLMFGGRQCDSPFTQVGVGARRGRRKSGVRTCMGVGEQPLGVSAGRMVDQEYEECVQ